MSNKDTRFIYLAMEEKVFKILIVRIRRKRKNNKNDIAYYISSPSMTPPIIYINVNICISHKLE